MLRGDKGDFELFSSFMGFPDLPRRSLDDPDFFLFGCRTLQRRARRSSLGRRMVDRRKRQDRRWDQDVFPPVEFDDLRARDRQGGEPGFEGERDEVPNVGLGFVQVEDGVEVEMVVAFRRPEIRRCYGKTGGGRTGNAR